MALPVEITRTDVVVGGVDDSFKVVLSGSMAGTPVSVVGTVFRSGGDVVFVAGWDPKTNAGNVPMAVDMFVKKLAKLHG